MENLNEIVKTVSTKLKQLQTILSPTIYRNYRSVINIQGNQDNKKAIKSRTNTLQKLLVELGTKDTTITFQEAKNRKKI